MGTSDSAIRLGASGRGSVGRAMAIAGRVEPRERLAACETNGACADGKTVWSWHPLLVSSWRRQLGPTGPLLRRGEPVGCRYVKTDQPRHALPREPNAAENGDGES